jgi:hypothetical protein
LHRQISDQRLGLTRQALNIATAGVQGPNRSNDDVKVSGAAIGPILLPLMLYYPMQLLICAWIARRYAAYGERPNTSGPPEFAPAMVPVARPFRPYHAAYVIGVVLRHRRRRVLSGNPGPERR